MLAASAALLLAGAGAHAQTAAAQAAEGLPATSTVPLPLESIPSTMQPDLAAPAVPDSYLIGRDDLLAVFVYQMPEFTVQLRVNAEGQIRIPMLPDALPVVGLTSPAAARTISEDLKRNGLARDPQVRVVVRQVMSHPVVVTGAVRQPLVVEAVRPLPLLEALARAGGLDAQAGTAVLVTGSDGAAIGTFDLKMLMQGTEADPLLAGGEVVRVLPALEIYTVGAVQKPGAFPITSDQPVTVLRAVALSQGLSTSPPADAAHSKILRRQISGALEEIPLNLSAILSHSAPDVDLQPGDLVYVPVNGRRKFINSSASAVTQAFVIALGYRGIF